MKGGVRGAGRACRWFSVAGWLAAAGTFVGFFSASSWFAELTSHFRVQYLFVLVAAAAVLAVGRRTRRALVFGSFALANVAAIYPLYVSEDAHVEAPVAAVRVLLSNVYAHNERYDLVLAAIERDEPDLIVLMEVDKRWLRRLGKLSVTHPYSVREPRDDNFGIALYSKYPLADPAVTYHGIVPSITAEVRTSSSPLYVVATHPLPPVAGFYARLRNSHLRELARSLRSAPRPLVLVGDLNVTPWSAHFARLLAEADLEDSMKGYGPQPSWPAQTWPASLPIDHCLYSAGVRVIDRRLGQYVGSDHLPVIVDLEIGASVVASTATRDRAAD